jgi:hypothetical protein
VKVVEDQVVEVVQIPGVMGEEYQMMVVVVVAFRGVAPQHGLTSQDACESISIMPPPSPDLSKRNPKPIDNRAAHRLEVRWQPFGGDASRR